MQKNKIPLFVYWFPILALSIISNACASDQLPQPSEIDCSSFSSTYTNTIKAIIDQSCAFSGCHLDNAPGIYDSYAGLLPVLEDGKFRSRVINQRNDATKGMPPDFTPDGRPKDLTTQQIELIDCWLQAGFPE